MTIAACFLTTEGVVLGADSTTTFTQKPFPNQHFDYAQKVFEVGENSTLGIVMWGMADLPQVSYRSLIALLADNLKSDPVEKMADAAERWSTIFRVAFEPSVTATRTTFHSLLEKERTPEENDLLVQLFSGHRGGFCLAGHLGHINRNPEAYLIEYGLEGVHEPLPLTHDCYFWGCPNMIWRVVRGYDNDLLQEIADSDKWQGSLDDLKAVASKYMLGVPQKLPLREAIDYVHASIYTTIKAMKLSWLESVCGGPIELSVISSDRNFRWVHHKSLGEATR